MPPSKWKIRYLRLVRRVQRIVRHRKLRNRSWWQPVRERLTDRRLWQPCRDSVASGLSIGLFFAMMPIPGQSLVATVFAVRSRANIPFAVLGCFVTNPFTEPFFRPLQHQFGQWLRERVGVPMPHLGEVDVSIAGTVLNLNVSSFILGFLAMGTIAALLAYPIVLLFSRILPHHLPVRKAKLKKKKPGNAVS